MLKKNKLFYCILNCKKTATITPIMVAILFFLAAPLYSQDNYSNWVAKFKGSLIHFSQDTIRTYFKDDFADVELESWKYNIQNGFLKFDSTRIIRLSENAILFHIPTNNKQYSGKNAGFYFDFIYRIYEIASKEDGFIITKRVMADYNPDFIKTKNTIEMLPTESSCLVENETKVNLKTNHLIFKLAKEFRIDDFQINGKSAVYDRFGYFMHAYVDKKGLTSFSVKGRIRGPDDHNQFFSIDSTNLFFRTGGFPLIPSPPPDNIGRYNFSKDTTEFDFTYVFPEEFKYVQYGEVYSKHSSNGKMIVSEISQGEWMDNLAFYAQEDWDVAFLKDGNAQIDFYLPKKDSAVLPILTSRIKKMLDWSYPIFNSYPDSKLKFIVLDKFVENGALNGNSSIITQNAEIILDDTYVHEILHGAPQPKLKNDFLWIKEGFTNYLSFNYLEFRDKRDFWANQKRSYLNAFDKFTEPLDALTSTRLPTYWTAYQKGPWIYRMLESTIGVKNFEKAMQQFSKMDDQVMANTREYFAIFETISDMDLKWFENQWLKRKENPALRIDYSVSSQKNDKLLKFKVIQETEPFKLPLEIEIVTEKKKIRKTVWIETAVSEFSFPVKDKLITVNFDPDSRLFALIKTDKMLSVDINRFVFPSKETVYRFKSNNDKSEVEYKIEWSGNKTTLTQKSGENISALELDHSFLPVKLINNEKTVYSINYSNGKIDFGNAVYDIQEPVFGKDQLLMLYLSVDWTNVSEESFLFHWPNSKMCFVSSAKCERISRDEIKLVIDNYVNSTDVFIKDGVPVKYIIDKDETFELIK